MLKESSSDEDNLESDSDSSEEMKVHELVKEIDTKFKC